jgi:hypothetical protein
MNLISIVIGLGALLWGILAFTPFLGWMYWFVLPFAVLGAGIGLLSSRSSGRNLNLFVILVGIVRLSIGHGFI